MNTHETHHMTYMGDMPCTGALQCTACGRQEPDERLASECPRTFCLYKPGVPASRLYAKASK